MFIMDHFFKHMEVYMKKIAAIVAACLALFVLFGCQSTDAPAATTEVVTPAPAETAEAPAPAPAPAPVEEEAPAPSPVAVADELTLSYEYLGYELGIEAADGKAVITYPEWVSEADVASFFGAEVAKYGAELDGVLYMFTAPGTVEIAYPSSVSAAALEPYVDGFIADLLSYVESFDIQPATV